MHPSTYHPVPSTSQVMFVICRLLMSSICGIAVKDVVWRGHNAQAHKAYVETAFIQHGHPRGLCEIIFMSMLSSFNGLEDLHTLYPTQHSCIKPNCARTKKGMLIKKSEARRVVLYTHDQGPVPAYSIHLYCEGTYASR
jgi:hypothetical protein